MSKSIRWGLYITWVAALTFVIAADIYGLVSQIMFNIISLVNFIPYLLIVSVAVIRPIPSLQKTYRVLKLTTGMIIFAYSACAVIMVSMSILFSGYIKAFIISQGYVVLKHLALLAVALCCLLSDKCVKAKRIVVLLAMPLYIASRLIPHFMYGGFYYPELLKYLIYAFAMLVALYPRKGEDKNAEL